MGLNLMRAAGEESQPRSDSTATEQSGARLHGNEDGWEEKPQGQSRSVPPLLFHTNGGFKVSVTHRKCLVRKESTKKINLHIYIISGVLNIAVCTHTHTHIHEGLTAQISYDMISDLLITLNSDA